MKQLKNEYVKAIKEVVRLEGIEAANRANHKALETGLIDLDLFMAGAHVLVKITMAR